MNLVPFLCLLPPPCLPACLEVLSGQTQNESFLSQKNTAQPQRITALVLSFMNQSASHQLPHPPTHCLLPSSLSSRKVLLTKNEEVPFIGKMLSSSSPSPSPISMLGCAPISQLVPGLLALMYPYHLVLRYKISLHRIFCFLINITILLIT